MLALLRLDLFSLSCGVKNTLRFVFSQTNVGFYPLVQTLLIFSVLREQMLEPTLAHFIVNGNITQEPGSNSRYYGCCCGSPMDGIARIVNACLIAL